MGEDMIFSIRVLDELQTNAEDMGDLFIPDDVKPGEVVVRRGHIYHRSQKTYVPIALGYWRPDNNNRPEFAAYLQDEEPGVWSLSVGYSNVGPELRAAFAAVGVSV